MLGPSENPKEPEDQGGANNCECRQAQNPWHSNSPVRRRSFVVLKPHAGTAPLYRQSSRCPEMASKLSELLGRADDLVESIRPSGADICHRVIAGRGLRGHVDNSRPVGITE